MSQNHVLLLDLVAVSKLLDLILFPFDVLLHLPEPETPDDELNLEMPHKLLTTGPLVLVHVDHTLDDLEQLVREHAWDPLYLAAFDFLSQLELVSGLKRSP